MFYKIYRSFTAVLSAILILIMCGVFTLQILLPESFYTIDSNINISSSYGKVVSFRKNSNVTKNVFNPKNNFYTAKADFLGIFPIKEVSIIVTDEKIVTVCGTPFGVKMFTDGVLIVGFSNIKTDSGISCPAVDSGLMKGDVLKSINGKEVFTNEDVAHFIENSGGNALNMTIERNGKTLTLSVKPQLVCDQNVYKAGFWVRDSSAGIGTLTFYDPQTLSFAGLGHAVCDVDTGTVLPFSSGEIVSATITKIKKGISGSPGELCGAFVGKDSIGIVNINNETGLYGTLRYKIDGINIPIANKQDIYEGAATILSTIDGTSASEYDIIIEKINLSDNSPTKNIVIKIVDEDLLSKTGGIVQGMSGSPILQDGKIVGAVTHVLVNDPTRGYGIFIENMLDAAG